MTEEIKTEEKECKCFCRSEGVKKFVIIALGTFVGFYCALSLFAVLHRPPMMGPGLVRPMGPCPQMHRFAGEHHKGFHNPIKGDFEKKMPVPEGERTPFEIPKK